MNQITEPAIGNLAILRARLLDHDGDYWRIGIISALGRPIEIIVHQTALQIIHEIPLSEQGR